VEVSKATSTLLSSKVRWVVVMVTTGILTGQRDLVRSKVLGFPRATHILTCISFRRPCLFDLVMMTWSMAIAVGSGRDGVHTIRVY